jgi:hypothetical protein
MSAAHANGVFVSEFGDLKIPQPKFDLSSHGTREHRYGHSSGSDSTFVRVSGTAIGLPSVVGRPGETWATRRLGLSQT